MTILRDSEAGWPESSSAGTLMCPIMISSTPARIAGLERQHIDPPPLARRVIDDRQAGVAVHVGVPVPGEVLRHRDLAGLVESVTAAVVMVDTRVGSAPKDRIPITGSSGFTLTSATGA